MIRVLSLLIIIASLTSCQSNGSSGERVASTDAQSDAYTSPSDNEVPLLVGTYTRKEGHVDGQAKGIHLVYLNESDGSLRYSGTSEAGPNPSYVSIHPTGKFAFAANETGGTDTEIWGSVSAFTVNEDKSLTLINRQSTEGIAPCHVSLDKQGSNLLVANYSTGSITSFPLAMNGRMGRAQTVIRYEGEGPDERQESPHAHYIKQLRDGRVITADLGTDTLRLHKFDGGQLEPALQYIVVKPGSGPRHIVEHPSASVLYVLSELDATITSFKKNENGAYVTHQNISTLPEGDERPGGSAAIKITPNGKFLYASNRGDHNNIAIYSVTPDGKLIMVSHQSSLGNVPRDIEISPNGTHLIAANQNSNNLVSFTINQETGLLQKPMVLKKLPTPVSIAFF